MKSMKSNYNANKIFKKGELRELKKTRDWLLVFSIIWTAITIFIVYDGRTSDIKICACYLALFYGWYYTYKFNKSMRLVKEYCKSLYIRPALDEQGNENVHIVK